MKIGLIRCMKTEDKCPGTNCFKAMYKKKAAFKDIEEEIELIGVTTCGGCPGKKAAARAAKMIRKGANAIALSSCITRGNPKGNICPYLEEMKQAITKKLGENIELIEHTH
ncbi:CGGC domain-containing protein [Clostridium oryzae]|uniref:CGGC domain protein n=1 Tax=Clostridium oryzae TaxID=1450648 RepID=A0A1V4IJ33_9CLOT|nr:CGGC domain-containing protein [Clostridium oryzae]OPJ59715.1 CGGC domain protein [Clostridium oryzae]